MSSQGALSPVPPPLELELPMAWLQPLKTCLRRICSWQVPFNWSVPDWFDEMRSVAKLAAVEAAGIFDPDRGVRFDTFVQSRVLARTLTFYRREQTFSRRHVDGVSLPEEQETLVPDQLPFAPDITDHYVGMTLREALALLPDACGWLLEELYLRERTVAEVARHLGISQRGVNKRKRAALHRLRRCLAAG